MSLFIRFTLLAAAAIVLLVVLAFVLKIVFVAAILAAIALGGIFAYRQIQRRMGPTAPIVRRG
jgi:hypothetical protein